MSPGLLISPQGRIARAPFWLGFAFVMLLNLFAGAAPVVGPFIGLMLIWPQIALQIKRLHDIGWSGWLLLFPFLVGLACATLIAMNGGQAIVTSPPEALPALFLRPDMHKALVYLEIAAAVQIAFLIWVGSTKGNADKNRFGPAPGAR
jgi:uncharacterized membrane protein YhaH (DUF805 family)